MDLVPIKPILGCVGIVADITTERCRQLLRKEIGRSKVDVVLHDGAPNVGSAWVADAFTQSGLVLMSLKLATEFLGPGGTFVTKVFRSRDYHPLMWVFKQLFAKVTATKPQSSRNVSAEIFVVCQEFLAPAKIDPKLLDARYVFQEVQDDAQRKLDIYHPEKYTRQREGYVDGDYLQHKKLPVDEFVQSADFLDLLATVRKSHAALRLALDAYPSLYLSFFAAFGAPSTPRLCSRPAASFSRTPRRRPRSSCCAKISRCLARRTLRCSSSGARRCATTWRRRARRSCVRKAC